MKPRYGEYDPATIALKKRQIEAQLDDYEREISDYAAFMERWRKHQGWPPDETKSEKNVSCENLGVK